MSSDLRVVIFTKAFAPSIGGIGSTARTAADFGVVGRLRYERRERLIHDVRDVRDELTALLLNGGVHESPSQRDLEPGLRVTRYSE